MRLFILYNLQLEIINFLHKNLRKARVLCASNLPSKLHMRILVIFFLFVLPSFAFGQFGINFHQSNLPFVGLNYEIKNKLRPELRIGTDNYFDETSIEVVLTYDIVNKDDYELYAGIGGRLNGFEGLVIPIGVNVYPLSTKQFGFHIELAPIIGESSVLRGSWGIRYQFNRGSSR
jgi:hypothetical protein